MRESNRDWLAPWPDVNPTLPSESLLPNLNQPKESEMQTPSVGRIVHYVSYGTTNGEYPTTCRAAVIAEVRGNQAPPIDDPDYWHYRDEEWCALAVLNPKGIFFDTCKRDDDQAPGTWHWPERVPGE